MPVDTFFLVKTFVTLAVVIDPVAAVPLFLALTNRYELRQRHWAAWQAVLVATLIIGVFTLFGQQILLYLGHPAAQPGGPGRSAAAGGRPRLPAG